MAIDWNYGSDSFRRIAPYLKGDFTCQRCGVHHKTWHPMCNVCNGGAISPLPYVPEKREFLFPAGDILRVIQGRPWQPRALKEIGIEPVIERYRYPIAAADFFFRRIVDLQSAGPFSMTLGDHPDDIIYEARLEPWGPIPMVRFEVDEFKDKMRSNDTVQVKVTAMVQLNLFASVT